MRRNGLLPILKNEYLLAVVKGVESIEFVSRGILNHSCLGSLLGVGQCMLDCAPNARRSADTANADQHDRGEIPESPKYSFGRYLFTGGTYPAVQSC